MLGYWIIGLTNYLAFFRNFMNLLCRFYEIPLADLLISVNSLSNDDYGRAI